MSAAGPPQGATIDVRLDGVRKSFGALVAVNEVTLDIDRGTIFSLLGPSGCGKTTTLRLIAGFEQPDMGDVYIRGRRVTAVPQIGRASCRESVSISVVAGRYKTTSDG